MRLRLRGAITRDLDWTAPRVPQIAEQVKLDADWYRVTNVAWAVKTEDGELLGWDVGLWLASSNPPVGTQ